MLSRADEVAAHEAARLFCLANPPDAWRKSSLPAALRGEVLDAWDRTRRRKLDVSRVAAWSSAPYSRNPLVDANVEAALDAWIGGGLEDGCAMVFLDPQLVVRVRRGGSPALSSLLDQLLVFAGYDYSEKAVGNTAASMALIEMSDVRLRGHEHIHPSLSSIDEAAALVRDPRTSEVVGVVVALSVGVETLELLAQVSRGLAVSAAARLESEQSAKSRVVVDRFAEISGDAEAWILATNGDFFMTNGPARLLEQSLRARLREVLFSSLLLNDFATREVELPNGQLASVTCEPVLTRGEVVGAIMSAFPLQTRESRVTQEAARRQGAHVAPTGKRDYASEYLASKDESARVDRSRVAANRDLMTPYRRARQEVAAAVRQRRQSLLVGETGVGKRTLFISQFLTTAPTGKVLRLDCAELQGEGDTLRELYRQLQQDPKGRPRLLLIERLNLLTTVTSRMVADLIRQFPADGSLQIAATVDATTVDATKPYGLLLGNFTETTHVPALRFRVEEIGEIAQAIVHRLAAGRSVRLNLKVLRILEGYGWPGNILELEDVIRYVLSKKPVGDIQPPDLPPVCFQGRSTKLTLLETAQCEAIIQALYEARGNRYQAAAKLGIARSTLYRKLDLFGIQYIA